MQGLLINREKEERKKNVVVKGTGREIGENLEKKVKKFIKNKVGIECKIEKCQKSGYVIIAKLKKEKKKQEIMRNKYKLKGKIFIKNDTTWGERKLQEIIKWAKAERERRADIRTGKGKENK